MLAGASCWVLYVDVLVLEMGGELTSLRPLEKEREKITLENAPHLPRHGDGGCALANIIDVVFPMVEPFLSFISVTTLSAGKSPKSTRTD